MDKVTVPTNLLVVPDYLSSQPTLVVAYINHPTINHHNINMMIEIIIARWKFEDLQLTVVSEPGRMHKLLNFATQKVEHLDDVLL